MDPLLKISDRPPTAVSPSDTVREAVQAMIDHGVGATVVVKDDGSIAGIFTERDVMSRVVAKHRDPETVRVEQVMTRRPATVPLGTSLEDALERMVSRDFRHIPIVEESHPVAIASVRRVLKYKLDQGKEELESLVSYFDADGPGG